MSILALTLYKTKKKKGGDLLSKFQAFKFWILIKSMDQP